MTKATRPLAVELDELATRFFGDEWVYPLSHFTGVNPRTLQRIRQVGRQGSEHSAARGALLAAAEAVDDFKARLSAITGTAR